MKVLMLIASLFVGSAFAAVECGKTGSIEQRIHDCGHVQKEHFKLVTRVKERTQTFEVYKDMRTGLLWSDRLFPNQLNHTNAYRACEYYIRKEMGDIKDVIWKLPSIDHWKEAIRSGILTALPNMKEIFWSDTTLREDPIRAYQFNGVYGDVWQYNKENGIASVRCVAQTY